MLHCMYILHFLHPSSIKGHLGCFHLLDLWIMLLRIGTYKCLFKILLSIALFSLVTFLQIGRLIHQRRRWHPSPVLLPGKSHGRRRLVGYSPWGCEESDTTERLPFFFFFTHMWNCWVYLALTLWCSSGLDLRCSPLSVFSPYIISLICMKYKYPGLSSFYL